MLSLLVELLRRLGGDPEPDDTSRRACDAATDDGGRESAAVLD